MSHLRPRVSFVVMCQLALTLAGFACSDSNGNSNAASGAGADGGTPIDIASGAGNRPTAFSGCLKESQLDYLFEPRDNDYNYSSGPVEAPLYMYRPIVDGSVLYMQARNGVHPFDLGTSGEAEFRSVYFAGDVYDTVKGYALNDESMVVAVLNTLGSGTWHVFEGPKGQRGPWTDLPPLTENLHVMEFVGDTVYGLVTKQGYDGELGRQVATTWKVVRHDLRSGEGTDLYVLDHPNPVNANSFAFGGTFFVSGEWLYGVLPTDALPATDIWRLPREGGELELLSIQAEPADELIPLGVHNRELYLLNVARETAELLAVDAEGGTARQLAEIDRSVVTALGVRALLPLDQGALLQVSNHFYWVAPHSSTAELVACVDDPQLWLMVGGATVVGGDLYAGVANMDSSEGSVARIPLPL